VKSLEERLLASTDRLLNEAARDVLPRDDHTDARLVVLEAVAAACGGWCLADFWNLTGMDSIRVGADPAPWADKIRVSIAGTGIPTALALSALSREVLPPSQQRKTGAYYTDWRLAELLAATAVPEVDADGPWVDPACGSGMLLAAAAMQVSPGPERDAVIRDRLSGADLSANALRGALLSVASLTEDLSAVRGFAGRLLRQDSLTSGPTWAELAPAGAALVIGNPPWEKLRVSRHEAAKGAGAVRDYGQSFEHDVDLTHDRSRLLTYVEQVASGMCLQGRGEHDLYKLFLELGMGIAAEEGVLALLLPAGLIRSQGTERLRRGLSSMARDLSISVVENRASHFAIDTRFKFLSVVAKIGDGRKEPIKLKVADRTGALPDRAVRLSRSQLDKVRSDLSIPEVRTAQEWDLYVRLASNAVTVGDPAGPWRPVYRREIDMTLDRKSFRSKGGETTLPLLEGRHVSQYRWRAKSYRSGEGRSAIWTPEPLSQSALRTQWHVPLDATNPGTVQRTSRSRIGFCDITGQTNERSLLVARVPEGVVCGNKVPTLAFVDGGDDREDLFLALANSLVVDWMLRRIVTTTVNFFLLDSLHLPRIHEETEVGQELIALARRLSAAEGDLSADAWQVGQWRARSDALVAAAWGLGTRDVEVVLRDFPLLDRGQPALEGEARSTITADCVLAELAQILAVSHPSLDRMRNAQAAGATPYVPAEYAVRGFR
jgi:hypothetical protein